MNGLFALVVCELLLGVVVDRDDIMSRIRQQQSYHAHVLAGVLVVVFSTNQESISSGEPLREDAARSCRRLGLDTSAGHGDPSPPRTSAENDAVGQCLVTVRSCFSN